MTNAIPPSARSEYLDSPLTDLIELSKKLEMEGKKIHYLNLGDPVVLGFPAPSHVKSRLSKVAKQPGSERYSGPIGNKGFVEAAINWENRENKLNLTEGDLFATNGISEGVLILSAALIDPGDEMLVPGPPFPQYSIYGKLFGGKPIEYRQNEENGWQPDVDDIRDKVSEETRGIVTINPNNPVGSHYDESTTKKIIDVAAEYSLILITDEIYDKIVYDDSQHVTPASISGDVPVIGLNGLSKKHRLSGYRIGYAYKHDPTGELKDIWVKMKKVAAARLSVSTPIMMASVAALNGPQTHIDEMNEELAKRAEFAHRRLNKIDGITAEKPNGAFYIFPGVDLRGKWNSDADFCLYCLEDSGVLLPHGSGFGEYGKGHFRSVLAPIEVMSEAFDKLEESMVKAYNTP